MGKLLCAAPLLHLPSVFPSNRVFSSESVFYISWPKYWSFRFSISPSNEYSGLISFSIDWLNLPVVQSTLKSFAQHHSSKASILHRSVFFRVQLSHPYMTIGKLIDLIQFSSDTQSCLSLCNPMNHRKSGVPVHHQLLESIQPVYIKLMMSSNHLNLCCPHLLLSSIFPSIRVFSNEAALHIKWPMYWSFTFNISSSNK